METTTIVYTDSTFIHNYQSQTGLRFNAKEYIERFEGVDIARFFLQKKGVQSWNEFRELENSILRSEVAKIYNPIDQLTIGSTNYASVLELSALVSRLMVDAQDAAHEANPSNLKAILCVNHLGYYPAILELLESYGESCQVELVVDPTLANDHLMAVVDKVHDMYQGIEKIA